MLDAFVNTVIAIATPVVAGLVVALLVKGLKHISISLNAAQEQRLRGVAEDAVMYAQEWAADRIKRHIPTNGPAKMTQAVTMILDRIPGIDDEEAERLVKAALANLEMGATEFLRDLKDKATGTNS